MSAGTRSEAMATSMAFSDRTCGACRPVGASVLPSALACRGVLSRVTMVSAGVSERHSSGIRSAEANLADLRIGELLEGLDVHPATRVLKLSEVRADLRLADVGAVDLPPQATRDHHRLFLLVGGELLDEERGRGVVAS